MIEALKEVRYNSKKLRDSARGERCTVRILGLCRDPDTSTSALAHLPDDSGTGKMGGKSDDWNAVIACDLCHAVLDGRELPRSARGLIRNEYEPRKHLYQLRALRRTWRRWIELGLVGLP